MFPQNKILQNFTVLMLWQINVSTKQNFTVLMLWQINASTKQNSKF